jgi:hypothetical protein
MWCNLPVTFFDVLPVTDGVTVSRMSQVCKTWRRNIIRINRFKMLHYMRLQNTVGQDDIDVCKSISKNYKKKLRLTNWDTAQKAFAHYVWKFLGINFWSIQEYVGRYLYGIEKSFREVDLFDLVKLFGYDEDCARIFRDFKTGDIIIVNDFYSVCKEKDYVSYCKKFRGLHELEILFPGVITWKFIVSTATNRTIAKSDFYRNSHILIRIKSNGFAYEATKFSKDNLLSDREIDAVMKFREAGKRRKLK